MHIYGSGLNGAKNVGIIFNGEAAIHMLSFVISDTQTLTVTFGSGIGSGTLYVYNSADARRRAPSVVIVLNPVILLSSTAETVANGTNIVGYTITNIGSAASGYAISSLPAGLNFDTATGLLSGAPTTPGTYTLTITATAGAYTGTATYTLTVN